MLTSQHRDANEESFIESITPYKRSYCRTLAYVILIIATGGFFYLLCRWNIRWFLSMNYGRCSPEQASILFVTTQWAQEIVPIRLLTYQREDDIRTFEFRYLSYSLSESTAMPLTFPIEITKSQIHKELSLGINDPALTEDRRQKFGPCVVNVPVKGWLELLIIEVLNPFYIFQLFSVALWMWDGYQIYASAILFTSIVSAAISLIETRRNLISARDMAHYVCPITVIRNNQSQNISSEDLVVGDLIEVPECISMPCDAILIKGDCVTNESMLTGESIPVLKDALPNLADSSYSFIEDKRHSLYSGTLVMQTRNNALAIVSRTGWMTLKGKLVRSILHPKPNSFQFYADSIKFVLVMFVIALLGFCIIIPKSVSEGMDTPDMIDRSLDTITVTVPPALPAAMTIGVAFAMSRLKKKKINCTSPYKVSVAGKISTFVFDKTGTLTEDFMDFLCYNPASEGKFLGEGKALPALNDAMATCHSLTKIQGKLDGEAQELKIFESTGWRLSENREEDIKDIFENWAGQEDAISSHSGHISNQMSLLKPNALGIVHIFHFNSKVKRMAVVVKEMQDEERYFLNMKGAPEVIYPLCDPATIPSHAAEVQSQYTQKGYRVLAYGQKLLTAFDPESITSQKMEDLEQGLTFLGLIVLQNKLKEETTPCIQTLKDVQLRTIMATGDAALTGIAVAGECGMYNSSDEIYVADKVNDDICWTHYSPGLSGILNSYTGSGNIPWTKRAKTEDYTIALIGPAFEHYKLRADAEHADLYEKYLFQVILNRAKIYARMSPDHKSMLVESLQAEGELVGMCGDGANDCGALSAADVGISLSEAEASIAAPFTSSIPNITCVIMTLIEGRCSLATSFQAFKYIELYSMIQYVTVNMLYWYESNLSDIQFLCSDLFTILPLAIVMSYTGPYHKLTIEQPQGALISVPILLSVLGQTVLQALAQIIGYVVLVQQSFYDQVHLEGDTAADVKAANYCWENTTVFLISSFLYIIMCCVYSIGKPFRRSSFTNLWYTGTVSTLLIIWFYLLIYPFDDFRRSFGVKPLPMYFRLIILGICLGFVTISYIFERYLVAYVATRHNAKQKRQKEEKYVVAEEKIAELSLNSQIQS